MKRVKGILIYTLIVFLASFFYFAYAYSVYPAIEERETFLSEIGEGLGNIGLIALFVIYSRTLLKLVLKKGVMAQRLLPEYIPPIDSSRFTYLLGLMDRTHPYIGIFAIAIILLHIVLMGMPMHILFFPLVLVLVIWQGLFGLFLTWRFSFAELKKFSYFVHAQFVTGIAIGIFAFFGHLLIDD